jgi:hypothetical protein
VTLDISVNQQRLVQAFLRFSSRACAKANERPGGQVARDILAGLFADAIRAAGPSATRSTASRPPWSPSPSYSPRSANDVAPQRRAAIAANSELQERELLKRARLASAIADALRARGADDTTARLAAEMGVLAFSTAYARWAAPDNRQPFNQIARAALRDLQARATTLGTNTDVRA